MARTATSGQPNLVRGAGSFCAFRACSFIGTNSCCNTMRSSRPICPEPLESSSLKHFSTSPFPLNHFLSYPPKTRWLTCYRRTSGGKMATQTQIQANRRSDRVSYSSGLAFEAKRGAGFAANTNANSFQRLPRHGVDTVPSVFIHLGELPRRRALRRQQSDVDCSVTDSPETENPEIGFVSHTPPTPAGPAPAITHSPQPPNPEIGFVPHATHRPSAPSTSALPIGAVRFERPLVESQTACLPRTYGWGMDSTTSAEYR